jgi:peptide/nickel transport system substrate-binding protein
VHPPLIKRFELHFFPTEEKLAQAFGRGIIGSVVGVNPADLSSYGLNPRMHHLERIPLPRTFAVFINQNKSPALRDKAVRKALDTALDRKSLVDAVVGGYGNALTGPIPTGFGITVTSTDTPEFGMEAARDILRKGGWKLNPETKVWEKTIDKATTSLSFSIATVNNSAFEATAEFLRKTWEELGAHVTVKQFEQSDLTQAIIRPRDYEALLFGTQLGRSLDYYSFWHSSQRNDPGLNVSLYANITTDSILSELRRNQNQDAHNAALQKFADELKVETPAIFLYSPELLYIFPNHVTGAVFKGVSEPFERYSNVYDWYIETESVWTFFRK